MADDTGGVHVHVRLGVDGAGTGAYAVYFTCDSHVNFRYEGYANCEQSIASAGAELRMQYLARDSHSSRI